MLNLVFFFVFNIHKANGTLGENEELGVILPFSVRIRWLWIVANLTGLIGAGTLLHGFPAEQQHDYVKPWVFKDITEFICMEVNQLSYLASNLKTNGKFLNNCTHQACTDQDRGRINKTYVWVSAGFSAH